MIARPLCSLLKAAAPANYATIEALSKERLSNFRLVCQSFKHAADPLFFSEIKLYCRKDYGRFTCNQRFLKAMTDGTSPFCRYAKILRIGIVSQALNKPNKSTVKRPTCSDNALMRALVSLKNVRTVQYVPLSCADVKNRDGHSAAGSFMSSNLHTLPLLAPLKSSLTLRRSILVFRDGKNLSISSLSKTS